MSLAPYGFITTNKDIWSLMTKNDKSAMDTLTSLAISTALGQLPNIYSIANPIALLSATQQTALQTTISRSSIAWGLIKKETAGDTFVREIGKSTLLVALGAAQGFIAVPAIAGAVFAAIVYLDNVEKEKLDKMRAEIAESMQHKLADIQKKVRDRIAARKNFEVSITAKNEDKSEKEDAVVVTEVRRGEGGKDVKFKVTRGNIIAAGEVLHGCPTIKGTLIDRLSNDDKAEIYASFSGIIKASHGSSTVRPSAQDEEDMLTYVQVLVDAKDAPASKVPVFEPKPSPFSSKL